MPQRPVVRGMVEKLLSDGKELLLVRQREATVRGMVEKPLTHD